MFVNLWQSGILITNYARSALWGRFFGRGFNSPHLHHVAASLLACRIFYKNTASLLSAAAPPSHKTYWVLREPYCALRRFSLRDFFTITFNIRLICSLVNALTTLHCRYHFFASSPSAYFIFSKIRLRFYRLPLLYSAKPIGFCGSILRLAALFLTRFLSIILKSATHKITRRTFQFTVPTTSSDTSSWYTSNPYRRGLNRFRYIRHGCPWY